MGFEVKVIPDPAPGLPLRSREALGRYAGCPSHGVFLRNRTPYLTYVLDLGLSLHFLQLFLACIPVLYTRLLKGVVARVIEN